MLYDSLNRLTRVDYDNGASIFYTYDAAGNRLTMVSQAEPPLDSTPPLVQITQPVTGNLYVTTNSSITLAGTASDASGIAAISCTNHLGVQGVVTGTTAWAAGPFTLSNGLNCLTVTASDPAGNAGSASLFVVALPPGAASQTVFSDNFDDNSIDAGSWTNWGSSVVESGQIMQVLQSVTDAGGNLRSKALPISPDGIITITRNVKLHYSQNYFIARTYLYFGNLPRVRISYGNMDYNSAPHMAVHGFYISRNDADPHDLYHNVADVSAQITPLWDTWFKETITYNPLTGDLTYSMDDTLKTTFNVGIMPVTNSPSLVLSFDSWGWFTGYQHLFDNLTVTQDQSDSVLTRDTDHDGTPDWAEVMSVTGASRILPYTSNSYTCQVQLSDGTDLDVTDHATWSLVNPAQGCVMNDGALSVGDIASNETVIVQAVWNGITNTLPVDLAVTVTNIFVSGPSRLTPYSTNIYTCTAQYADGSVSNITAQSAWSLSINSLGAELHANALGVGEIESNATVTVQAVYGSRTGACSVVLYPVPDGVLAAWDLYGLPAVPNPTVATAAVYTVSSVPLLTKVRLGAGGYTNSFFGGQLTNSSLADATSGYSNKYFSLSISNRTPVTVTNVAMMIRRFSLYAPTGFTLRVSADVDFSTYTDCHFQITGTTSKVYSWITEPVEVSGTNVFFRLYCYGENTGTNTAIAGFAGTTNTAAGAANSGLSGTLYDLIIYGQQADADLDRDGLPDPWEQHYFGGRTGVAHNTICSNGFNTAHEAYIAGLNPNDPAAALLTSILPGGILQWGAVSGRVYSVYWATNLMSGFQCLESNIPWTRGCFTNQTDVPQVFYKISVELGD